MDCTFAQCMLDLFNGVFVHRFRCVSVSVRAVMVAMMPDWIRLYPQEYMQNTCGGGAPVWRSCVVVTAGVVPSAATSSTWDGC